MNREKTTIILGVDPGTRVTGFGAIRITGGAYQAIDYGCIRPPPDLELSDRYLVIFESVESLIDRLEPESVVVETQFVSKNVKSAMMVAMARCSVILAARKRGLPVHEYAPRRAKQAVVGNGAASKEQVQAMVQRLLSLEKPPKPEDAADALALAICHAQTIKFNQLIGAQHV